MHLFIPFSLPPSFLFRYDDKQWCQGPPHFSQVPPPHQPAILRPSVQTTVRREWSHGDKRCAHSHTWVVPYSKPDQSTCTWWFYSTWWWHMWYMYVRLMNARGKHEPPSGTSSTYMYMYMYYRYVVYCMYVHLQKLIPWLGHTCTFFVYVYMYIYIQCMSASSTEAAYVYVHVCSLTSWPAEPLHVHQQTQEDMYMYIHAMWLDYG